MVRDDSPQEDIRVRRGLERQRVVLEPLVQSRGDRVAVRVRDGLHTLQAADAEHLVVHAEYALQVAKLVGKLGGEAGLQLVVRCARHEGGENRRHAELRLEPVREYPREALALVLLQRPEALCVDTEVDVQR